MQEITLGIVSAPGLTTTIGEKAKESMQEVLNDEISDTINWDIQIQVDQITGAAENSKEIMDQAIHIKQTNNWDYVISLTDLPIFYKEFIVVADTDSEEKVAQVSLPSFGIFPTVSNVKKALVHMAKELYYSENNNGNIEFLQNGIGIKEGKQKSNFFHLLQKAFKFTSIDRMELGEKSDGVSVRFLIRPKLNGRVKLIAGMTVANSPWSIMPSFKKVIGLAFATGSYMLIFNTLWQLSGIYEVSRFLILMFTAMIAMVTWIVFAHNLWEKKHYYKSKKLRLMYNATTITTLGVSVLMFYISMFLLFSIAVLIFVPGDTFKEVLGHEVVFADYAKLAWLVTSAATVAGAIGAGLENEESVRQITYGYRQYIRSKKIQKEEEKQEKEKQGKTRDDSETME